jgi:hypothetical protein
LHPYGELQHHRTETQHSRVSGKVGDEECNPNAEQPRMICLQTTNQVKAGCLRSHPLLNSCLEELTTAVAGSPLEGGAGGSPMLAIHDGWQRGEEGRPEVLDAVVVVARVIMVIHA